MVLDSIDGKSSNRENEEENDDNDRDRNVARYHIGKQEPRRAVNLWWCCFIAALEMKGFVVYKDSRRFARSI
ncbi:hypothetical protein N7466_007905 [Penicillium verhagenii]|uniref:uncharacterized protein n=1 Tax=Penicillium verhagenii TaxID=1562060 RepID=UPI00254586A9|nr:uncharacterized protein N7466_007905 [Penicillium verhagenii]KAJ5928949.1 hypothetical protein N7466_007905 [Penicillium verhagenii]